MPNSTIQWNSFPVAQPHEYGWYLVALQKVGPLGVSKWVETSYWANHCEHGDRWADLSSGTVTHWAELPEVPQEEGDRNA